MADFVDEVPVKGPVEAEAVMIDASNPQQVLYCGVCSMPPEYCEYGTCYDRCLPWIMENCPEIIASNHNVGGAAPVVAVEGEVVDGVAKISLEGTEAGDAEKKKPRGGGAAAPKKAKELDTKIVIAKVQRQKRKYITVVGGLETVPDLKIKDAARIFGKKFSSGASVQEAPNGSKEVVIQGDNM